MRKPKATPDLRDLLSFSDSISNAEKRRPRQWTHARCFVAAKLRAHRGALIEMYVNWEMSEFEIPARARSRTRGEMNSAPSREPNEEENRNLNTLTALTPHLMPFQLKMHILIFSRALITNLIRKGRKTQVNNRMTLGARTPAQHKIRNE